jgi:tetratricopeptide (TPR) repeat protein
MARNCPHWILQALVLLVTITGESLAGESQQAVRQEASVTPARLSVVDSEFQPTPEDIGDAMLVQRRYHEALDAYRKMPTPSPGVWNKMGIAYQMMFALKDAARCYRESLGLRSNSANVLNNLGTVYYSQGDYRKAESLYRKALKLDPNAARIAMNLGTNLMVQSKYREGADMYKHALDLDPDVSEDSGAAVSNVATLQQRRAMNYYKARACAQGGMTDRAIQYLQKAVREGFTGLRKVALDSSFDRLHGNPAFERMMAREEEQK